MGLSGLISISNSGFVAGPGINISVTDNSTGKSFQVPGIFNMNTGRASTFLVSSSVLAAQFLGDPGTMAIVDPITLLPLISGFMEDGSTAIAHFPGGTGSFKGLFEIDKVDPAVLGLFGLTSFDPNGSVSLTYGQDVFDDGVLRAAVGGGSATFDASGPTPTPEASTLLLGLIGGVCVFILRKQKFV